MIAKLRNLGPKSEAMLGDAGIHSLEQLQALGAVQAYVQVKRAQKAISLNLLWALEGALTERPWQDVAKHDRLRLMLEVEALESQQGVS